MADERFVQGEKNIGGKGREGSLTMMSNVTVFCLNNTTRLILTFKSLLTYGSRRASTFDSVELGVVLLKPPQLRLDPREKSEWHDGQRRLATRKVY